MDITDLDDDEFEHLVLWLRTVALGREPLDLRAAPAWRFAQLRMAVDAGAISYFPEINY